MNINKLKEAFATVTVDDISDVYQMWENKINQLQMKAVLNFEIGDKAYFIAKYNKRYKNQRIEGIITKINRKTISIKANLNSLVWKVSPDLVKK
jgi:hypothetical protein